MPSQVRVLEFFCCYSHVHRFNTELHSGFNFNRQERNFFFFGYENINNTQTASKDVTEVRVQNKYIDGCVINQSIADA